MKIMDIKILITFVCLISYTNSAGMLRRTPKVYNALITTDDNLQSSRAFPVIQPTIHETGIAHYPYGPFNPYKIFHPPIVHINSAAYESRQLPEIVHQNHHIPSPYDSPPFPTGPYHQHEPTYETNQIGLPPQNNQPFIPPQNNQPQHNLQMPQPPLQPQNFGPIHQQGYYPQQPQIESNFSEAEQKQDQLPVIPAEANENSQPQQQQQPQETQQQQQPQGPPQPPPIPLNEFGLPPSLIPLQTYQPHHLHFAPSHPNAPHPLQPYSFHTYPIIYDQYNHYHPGQDHYLPHFGYFPPHSYGIPIHRPGKNRPTNPPQSVISPTTITNNIDPNLSSTDSDINITEAVPKQQPDNNVSIDNIKNGIENKDKNIPDVPPPPLPAGAKKAQNVIAL